MSLGGFLFSVKARGRYDGLFFMMDELTGFSHGL